jgi:hypothetical protein
VQKQMLLWEITELKQHSQAERHKLELEIGK